MPSASPPIATPLAHARRSGRRRRDGAALALALALGLMAPPSPALAHPHVFVDAKAEVVFNPKGEIVAVRNIWRFDEAYSAFASQGLDKNRDGKLSVDELAPLARLNVESMDDYAFFTFITAGDKDIDFKKPTQYWLEADDDGQLILYFTLPTKAPVKVAGLRTRLEIYDPTYFVAFKMVGDGDEPILLDQAPAACAFKVFRPEGLDPAVAATLAQIPADQRQLPAELQLVTDGLTNGADISCP